MGKCWSQTYSVNYVDQTIHRMNEYQSIMSVNVKWQFITESTGKYLHSIFSGGRLRSESGEITLEDLSDANLLQYTPESGSGCTRIGKTEFYQRLNKVLFLFWLAIFYVACVWKRWHQTWPGAGLWVLLVCQWMTIYDVHDTFIVISIMYYTTSKNRHSYCTTLRPGNFFELFYR